LCRAARSNASATLAFGAKRGANETDVLDPAEKLGPIGKNCRYKSKHGNHGDGDSHVRARYAEQRFDLKSQPVKI
jgi:hypothetical protein